MIVTALAGSAALLLVVAGVAKFRTPGPAATMIVSLSPRLRPLSRARLVARATGVVEVGAGVLTLAVGGRAAMALLLACYLVLTAVALRLALGDERSSCGCFGAADGEVGAAHVVLDLAGVAVAVAGLVRPPAAITGLLDHGALTGATLAVQAGLLAALAYLSITALPALNAARRTSEGAR